MSMFSPWRRLRMPASVFGAVAVIHYVWLGFFPEQHPAQAGWVSLDLTWKTWWRGYIETQNYWLGFSYALSLAFAAYALRRYREERFRGARNLAIAGVTFSGFLATTGCYLLGCCGSPMLVVYLSLFGAAFRPLAKPLIAGLTVLALTAAWVWMNRKSRLSTAPVTPADCASQPANNPSRISTTTAR